MSCQLEATGLSCTATNHGDTGVVGAATFCIEPYLVVTQTGAVHGTVSCSPVGLRTGESTHWLADLGVVPAALCGADFSRCAMFVLGENGNPWRVDELHASIRSVQDTAPDHDFSRPGVRECDAAWWRWRANPLLAQLNELAAGKTWFVHHCIAMPRAKFDCLERVRTRAALAVCDPIGAARQE